MQRTDALKGLLEDLTVTFNGGERVPVKFDTTSYASEHGHVAVAPNVRESLGRSLSGPNELRVLVNTLSHEVEHTRESDLTSKRRFMDAHPEQPQVAGAVINILEDQYIDWSRTRRFPGLRKSQAFVIDAVMDNHHRRPRIDTLPTEQALVEGLMQVAFAGYAKGIQDAGPTVREFLAWARGQIEAARTEPDAEVREAIAHRVTAELLARIPDDADQDGIDEAVAGLPTDTVDMQYQPDPDADPTDADPADGDADFDFEDFFPDDDADDADPTDADVDVDFDPDEIADALDQMDDADDDRSAGSWYGVGDTDYDDPDEYEVRRYEDLQERIEESQTPLGERKAERDERMWGDGNYYKERMDESGMTREIVDAFERLVSRDHPLPADDGDEVNVDGFIRHMAGDPLEDELYIDYPMVETGDRAIGVALDMSGSMSSAKAKLAMGALAIATETVGDELVASAFQTTATTNRGTTETPLITAPGEEFEWGHLDGINAGGLTPTADGITDVVGLLKQTSKRERVLIVVTDGDANWTLDGRKSGDAMTEAERMVRATRRDGIKVVGLGVDVVPDTMDHIFGEGGYVRANMDNLADALVDVYSRQMRVTA